MAFGFGEIPFLNTSILVFFFFQLYQGQFVLLVLYKIYADMAEKKPDPNKLAQTRQGKFIGIYGN
jgi:hypothetical protein